jgi:DNA-binding NtrC family response regulator
MKPSEPSGTLSVEVSVSDHAPLFLEISTGQALLVGRAPNPSKLKPDIAATLQGVDLVPVTILDDRVSSNHLVVWNAGKETRVLDLRSKNGSWVKLPSDAPARFQTPDHLAFRLAMAGTEVPLSHDMQAPEWVNPEDFAGAVCRSINDWLRSIGTAAQATVQLHPPFRDNEDTTLLADGSRLSLTPTMGFTLDISWQQIRDRINAYISEQNIRFEQLQGHDDDFVLASPVMRIAHRELSDAAAYGVRAMLLGPTGAGKERMARCYHRHSRAHRGPYVSVNCALLKEGLLYAQLFGAKRGSFTGANNDVVGVIESANDGTLFLDEIGDMDREVQKALLRFLDTRGEYQRLGDSVVRHATVQVVCATNTPLDDPEYRQGRFRDDLWYRLGVKVVRIPPLCQRPLDVLAFFRARTIRGGQVRVLDALTKEAVQFLLSDPLPGNFRDLENFVDRLPVNAGRGTIDVPVCAAALTEGRKPVDRKERRTGNYPRLVTSAKEPQTDWSTIFEQAMAAFLDDHSEAPQNWAQLHQFLEKYVKPVFVAHACQLQTAPELSKSTNYSELARKLLIADGSTVKSHLARYLERFHKKNP